MKFAIRNRGLNYGRSALYICVGFFYFGTSHVQFAGYIWASLGIFTLADAALPAAWLNSQLLVVRAPLLSKTILLKDIVRLESDPLRYFADRNVIVHEASGRKTEVSRLDTNKFIGALSGLLPDTVKGRSTGVAPPPYSGTMSFPATTGASSFNFNLISWMSLVYDSKSHTIRNPSEQGPLSQGEEFHEA